jgi:hypothetical protein
MDLISFIRDFPQIEEKDAKYYLYRGMMASFDANKISAVVGVCLEQDVFKRKILLNRVITAVSQWSLKNSDDLFDNVFNLKNSLSSYFKKESASLILMALFPYVSKNSQNKLVRDLSQSKYKNNRKRIYNLFYKNWSSNYQKIIEKAWTDFMDDEAIGLIISKMPKDFLLKNYDDISDYFNEEELTYDFFRKILRNKFYARLYDEIPSEISKLKNTDPISFIAIKKERGEKLDIAWAIEIYKKFSYSKYLARWYSEIGLWEDILREKPNFLSEIKA